MRIPIELKIVLACLVVGGPLVYWASAKTSVPLMPAEQPGITNQKLPPRTICVVDDYRGDVVAQKCAIGQKVAYLPSSWGNEQLPVMFAAVNCDLNKSVVQTNGGVTCIYAPIELVNPQAPAKPDPHPLPSKHAGGS